MYDLFPAFICANNIASLTNNFFEVKIFNHFPSFRKVDGKFSKSCKTYLDQDAVYNFINSMDKESKHCSEVTKKHFNKELVITKKANEDFKNSTKCSICGNGYVDNDVKV